MTKRSLLKRWYDLLRPTIPFAKWAERYSDLECEDIRKLYEADFQRAASVQRRVAQ